MHTATPGPGHTTPGRLLARTAGGVASATAAAGLLLTMAAPAHAETTKAYTTPGEHTFVVPAGVSQIRVTLTGAGGGGGGAHPGDDAKPAWGGGGGGGGATVSCTFTVRPGNALLIDVGAGGAGGSIFAESAPAGGRSRATILGKGGSAEGGHGGETAHKTRSGDGGLGGDGWGASGCAGTDRTLAMGKAGTSSGSSRGGMGGAAAVGVPSACPAGAGDGGNGGNGGVTNRYSAEGGSPGRDGCVAVTY